MPFQQRMISDLLRTSVPAIASCLCSYRLAIRRPDNGQPLARINAASSDTQTDCRQNLDICDLALVPIEPLVLHLLAMVWQARSDLLASSTPYVATAFACRQPAFCPSGLTGVVLCIDPEQYSATTVTAGPHHSAEQTSGSSAGSFSADA